MTLSARDLSMLAQGWDAAVAAMRYEDGTPVEIVSTVNPYRAMRPEPPEDDFGDASIRRAMLAARERGDTPTENKSRLTLEGSPS